MWSLQKLYLIPAESDMILSLVYSSYTNQAEVYDSDEKRSNNKQIKAVPSVWNFGCPFSPKQAKHASDNLLWLSGGQAQIYSQKDSFRHVNLLKPDTEIL